MTVERGATQQLRQLAVRILAQAGRIGPVLAHDVDGLPAESAPADNARSLLQLPVAERERLLERAAAVVADDYEGAGLLTGFDAMGWGDHRDDSIADK